MLVLYWSQIIFETVLFQKKQKDIIVNLVCFTSLLTDYDCSRISIFTKRFEI